MRKAIIIVGLSVLILISGLYAKRKFYNSVDKIEQAKIAINDFAKNDELKDGDLIFQASVSEQSKAIQLATRSKYSHCGIIYRKGNDYFVLEAVQPVKRTPLDQWMARGKDGHYVIKRLKNAGQILTPSTIKNMKDMGDKWKGKNYDLYFEWSDDKIYCSELIWKIYQRTTGVELGKLQKLSEFDLTNDIVKKKMKERYGTKIPMNEIVISPASIFESDMLSTVKSN
ncbi:MAG: YiiX family permuted papain-like enzyme [Daejeonella sp.]